MDTTILEELGLTKSEAKVYLALLKLGSVTASEIICKCGLHRNTGYDVLERLQGKGLVGFVEIKNKKFYEATTAQRLMDILKAKEARLKIILPELLNISPQPTVRVRVLKGKEGIKTALDELINIKPNEELEIGSGEEIHAIMPDFFDSFQQRRIQKGIKSKLLFRNNPAARQRAMILSKLPLTEIRFLPKRILNGLVITIYDNRFIIFLAPNEQFPLTIFIEGEHIASSCKEYFEWLWELSTDHCISMKKILYVGNDKNVIKTLKSMLPKVSLKLKFKLKTVSSGKECIKKTKVSSFDLILFDTALPDIAAWEIFKILKKTIKNVKYVFVSKIYISAERKNELKKRGISDYITKPFKREVLIQKLIKLL